MPKQNNSLWRKYGFVMGSKNRRIILKRLDAPQTPLELAERTKLGMNLTSRALRELLNEGIVECKNPDAKVGRIYDLTKIGREILNKLIKDR